MAINKQQALEIARRQLQDDFGREMVILEDAIVEKDFGWVFMSASQAFLQTRDPNKSIPGIGPLIVSKADGSTEFLSTSGPPEEGIEIYEQKWRNQRSKG
jgi:hypothetical protein